MLPFDTEQVVAGDQQADEHAGNDAGTIGPPPEDASASGGKKAEAAIEKAQATVGRMDAGRSAATVAASAATISKMIFEVTSLSCGEACGRTMR